MALPFAICPNNKALNPTSATHLTTKGSSHILITPKNSTDSQGIIQPGKRKKLFLFLFPTRATVTSKGTWSAVPGLSIRSSSAERCPSSSSFSGSVVRQAAAAFYRQAGERTFLRTIFYSIQPIKSRLFTFYKPQAYHWLSCLQEVPPGPRWPLISQRKM